MANRAILQVVVNQKLKDIFAELAKEKGMKTTTYVRSILIDYLNENTDIDIKKITKGE